MTPAEEHESHVSPTVSNERLSCVRGKPAQWKASPLWIAPVVFVVSLVRGMTMAPRVDIYASLACTGLELEGSINSTVPTAHMPSPSYNAPPSYSERRLVSFINPHVLDNCTADPNKVQEQAARIQASVQVTESILSTLTTAWLTHQSDIYGRKKLLAVSVSGTLIMDAVYIALSNPTSTLTRFGEPAILMASVVDGLLGAHGTFNSLVHAYLSDCSGEGSRSKIFAMMQGVLYVGLAIGPWINGAILNFTSGANNQTLFTCAVALSVVYLCFIVFVLPESLSQKRHPPSTSSAVSTYYTYDQQIAKPTVLGRIIYFMKTVLLKPVAVLFPQRIDGRSGYDWNLMITGFALLIYTTSHQIHILQLLYVKHVYGWDSEILGYYMSLQWVLRGLNLLVVLPSILTYFMHMRHPSSVAMDSASPSALASAIGFDLTVAAGSFFLDATSLALVVVAPSSSQALFVFFNSLTAFASGGGPAIQSLGAVSLCAMGKKEVGLIFGALGLVNSAAHVIAPGIYAALYAATVAVFPKAVILLSSLLLYMAVGSLLGVRPDAQIHRIDERYAYEQALSNDSGDECDGTELDNDPNDLSSEDLHLGQSRLPNKSSISTLSIFENDYTL